MAYLRLVRSRSNLLSSPWLTLPGPFPLLFHLSVNTDSPTNKIFLTGSHSSHGGEGVGSEEAQLVRAPRT